MKGSLTFNKAFDILPRGCQFNIGPYRVYLSKFFRDYQVVGIGSYIETGLLSEDFGANDSLTEDELTLFELEHGFPFITELARMYLEEQGER